MFSVPFTAGVLVLILTAAGCLGVWAVTRNHLGTLQHDDIRYLQDTAKARSAIYDARSNESLRLIAHGSGRQFATQWESALTTAKAALADSPDSEDSSAGYLQTVIADDPEARIRQLEIGPSTPAVVIELAMASLTAGNPSRAVACGGELLEHDPWDWRGQWLQGLGHLAGGDFNAAAISFDDVYEQLPGELAPKLALALALEQTGEQMRAARLFETCVRTDASFVPAGALGLYRLHRAAGDLDGCEQALELIPPSSSRFGLALKLHAFDLCDPPRAPGDLAKALEIAERPEISAQDRERIRISSLRRRLGSLRSAESGDGTGPSAEQQIRFTLEDALRQLARLTLDREERVRLIDEANQVRPWTLR